MNNKTYLDDEFVKTSLYSIEIHCKEVENYGGENLKNV